MPNPTCAATVPTSLAAVHAPSEACGSPHGCAPANICATAAGAWSEFRVRFLPLEQTLPTLVLVSTDGLANSFRTDADFLKVGTDLRQMYNQLSASAAMVKSSGPLNPLIWPWAARCGSRLRKPS